MRVPKTGIPSWDVLDFVPAVIRGTEPIMNKLRKDAVSIRTTGTMHVQVLRTAPTMNFNIGGTPTVPIPSPIRDLLGFRQAKWNMNGGRGIFEFRMAIRKAINAAKKYIYIEDQAFLRGKPCNGLELD